MWQNHDGPVNPTDNGAPFTSDRDLIAAVARAYYADERTRVEIAAAFGISRFRVARLLARARDEGIVTIHIHDSGVMDRALASRLKDALGLERCEVVRSHGDQAAIRQQIGAVAASLLTDTLHPHEVLGVSWGRTLTAATSQLERLPPLSIVQLTGVLGGDISSSPLEVARQTFRRSGGHIYPIFAPLYVQDGETAMALRGHPDIRSAMDLFPKLTTALLSVGAWNRGETGIWDALRSDERIAASSAGCVADIAGVLIDGDGAPVVPTIQERCINISFEELRHVPRVLAIAGGAAKSEAVRAVARSGLMSELVTDHTLARAILGEGE